MKTWGIIAAAGSGARLGADMPKGFVTLSPGSGRPMLVEATTVMLSLEGDAAVEGLILVVPRGWIEQGREVTRSLQRPVEVIEGGATRQESVRTGLEHVPKDADVVVVHDAARPFASMKLFEDVLRAVKDADGAIAALPIVDAVKRVGVEAIAGTVPRDGLWRAQTPQAFWLSVLIEAHDRAREDDFVGADDAELVERAGGRVVVVPGEESNTKITTALDLRLAHWNQWAATASAGSGYDAHALVPGRALVLGGVVIPFEKGLDGHSDADVLCHAVADAILGAANQGDLGRHFPSHEERWKDISGGDILRHVAALLADRDLVVRTVDATVVIEEPVLEPFKEQMKKNISAALGCLIINIKATTTDKLGIVGRGEGAAALATVTVGRAGVPSGAIRGTSGLTP